MEMQVLLKHSVYNECETQAALHKNEYISMQHVIVSRCDEMPMTYQTNQLIPILQSY